MAADEDVVADESLVTVALSVIASPATIDDLLTLKAVTLKSNSAGAMDAVVVETQPLDCRMPSVPSVAGELEYELVILVAECAKQCTSILRLKFFRLAASRILRDRRNFRGLTKYCVSPMPVRL